MGGTGSAGRPGRLGQEIGVYGLIGQNAPMSLPPLREKTKDWANLKRRSRYIPDPDINKTDLLFIVGNTMNILEKELFEVSGWFIDIGTAGSVN